MKKILSVFLITLFTASAFVGCGRMKNADVHVFYYTYSDTYISTVRSALDKALSNAGVSYQDHDSNNSQTTQTEQVQTAITKGAKLLVVNIVTTGSDDAASGIVELARKADIPTATVLRRDCKDAEEFETRLIETLDGAGIEIIIKVEKLFLNFQSGTSPPFLIMVPRSHAKDLTVSTAANSPITQSITARRSVRLLPSVSYSLDLKTRYSATIPTPRKTT